MKKHILIISLFLNSFIFAGLNDSLFGRQWPINGQSSSLSRSTGELTRINIQSDKPFDMGLSNLIDPLSKKELIVAVLDSGIDLGHPDLSGRIWFNKAKCLNLDQEARQKEDCYGWNFLDGNSDLTDDIGHGTHVSGIIAANRNNVKGIAGAAFSNVKIMPLKVLSKKVNGFVYNNKLITNIIAKAIVYAVKNGAQVINMSLGWPRIVHSRRIRGALKYAFDNNVVIVVASGNNNKSSPVYPCASEGVICVGAVDNNNQINEFSNYGSKVDVVASGEGIVSTFPRSLESRNLRIAGYELKKGSSQAAPFVTAVVANLLVMNPSQSLAELKTRLYSTTQKVEGDKNVKYGLINFKKALNSKKEKWIEFLVKSLDQITLKNDNTFSFELKYQATLGDISKVAVSVSTDRTDLEFKTTEYVTTKSGTFLIEGFVFDRSNDAHFNLTIKYQLEGQNFSFTKELYFSSNPLLREIDSQVVELNISKIARFKSGRTSTALKAISDLSQLSEQEEYFYIDQKKQTSSKSVVSLLALGDSISIQKELILPKVSKVLFININDYNLDGQQDYFVYSLGKDRRNLIFSYFNHDGSLLFSKNSHWFFPITAFKGLPFVNGRPDYHLLKVHSEKFGLILVPAFSNLWTMPEEDNIDDPLDELYAGKAKRFFYLLPEMIENKVILRERVLGSFRFYDSLRRSLNILGYEELSLINLMEQSADDRGKGKLELFLTSGIEFTQKKYLVRFSDQDTFKASEIHLPQLFLTSNKHQLLSSGEFSSFSLLSKTKGRFGVWKNGNSFKTSFQTHSYGDAIFDVIDSFKIGSTFTNFIESRYFVHSLKVVGAEVSQSKLPINRESSFPGVLFSETIFSTEIGLNGTPAPALLIDATLIYGNRIYFMVESDKGLVRPIEFSYKIPEHCLSLGIKKVKFRSHLSLLCKTKASNSKFVKVFLNI